MRDDVKKFRTGCLLIVAILIVCIILYIKNQNERNKDLNQYGRYTIGVTHEKEYASKANDYITYYFYYKGIKYSGKNNLQLDVKVPDGRYYVIFSTKNPYNNYMFFDKPVPGRITIAPKEGWLKLDSIK
jgi:hypothetical protein